MFFSNHKTHSQITLKTRTMNHIKKLAIALLGRKREYAIKGLGVFHSKVCDWWPNERCGWWCTLQLPSYSAETVIWLDGDTSAPLPRQILDLQVLLENWKSVNERVGSRLPDESRLAHKEEIYASWQNRFYPEEIKLSEKYNNSWEITFTTYDLDYSFSFIWKIIQYRI